MKKLNLLIFLFVIVIQATFPSRLIAQINCPEPTGLTVTVNSQNSVTLTWLASNFSTIFNVQYQSSNAATTGIGFRLHYNSSSMKVASINQYSEGALVMTRPEAAQNDTNNKDNNDATDAYLTFAWFDMNGQWPMATQVNLATIEFERLNNGSNNYSIDYSVTSNSAGYQFVK